MMPLSPHFPKLNDVGMGSRKLAAPMHANDVGLKSHVAKLPMVHTPANDVGLGIGKLSVPKPGSKNMSINELQSRRQEVGRMPRAPGI